MSVAGYVSAASLDEVSALLAAHPRAKLLAGGYNLLLPINRKQLAGSLLIDLRKIGGLSEITLQPDGGLQIGAMATIGAIAADGVVRKRWPALSEAAEQIGDAQVRNRATLGGNVSAAHPESDLPAVLLALGATLQLRSEHSSRNLPAEQFFTGPRQTAKAREEVLASATLPAPTVSSGAAYERFKHPATLYALCGVAASVKVGPNAEITAARVGVTGALSHPMLMRQNKQMALDKSAADGFSSTSGQWIPEGVVFRDDFFASAEYRSHLLHVLTRRALKRASERAA